MRSPVSARSILPAEQPFSYPSMTSWLRLRPERRPSCCPCPCAWSSPVAAEHRRVEIGVLAIVHHLHIHRCGSHSHLAGSRAGRCHSNRIFTLIRHHFHIHTYAERSHLTHVHARYPGSLIGFHAD